MRFARLSPILLTLALAGCGLFSKATEGPLIPAPTSPISDVPIPAGFSMTKDSTSKVVTTSSLRFVDHHYKGDEGYLPVAAFYKEQMPKAGWTLAELSQPGGIKEVSLHFTNTKTKEDCLVTITTDWLGTIIHIRIDPAGRSAGG